MEMRTLLSTIARQIETAKNHAGIEEAIGLVAACLPAVPVMNRDDMVGVITPTDVCRALCEMMGSKAPDAPAVMTLTTKVDASRPAPAAAGLAK